jgi:hypothetical protein
MIGKVMKCGRCGQWIPLAQWKYAARRLVHDNCAAVSATQSSRGVTATAIAKVVPKSPAANALSCRHSQRLTRRSSFKSRFALTRCWNGLDLNPRDPFDSAVVDRGLNPLAMN